MWGNDREIHSIPRKQFLVFATSCCERLNMSQVPSACNHVTLKICWWPVLRPDYSHTYSIVRTKPNPDGRCRLQYTYAHNLRKFRYSYYRDWLLVAMTIGTRFPCVAAFTVYTCMLIINSTNYSRSKFVLLSFSIFVYLKIGGQSYLVQYSSTYMVTGSTPYVVNDTMIPLGTTTPLCLPEWAGVQYNWICTWY